METTERLDSLQQVIARAWADDDFKTRLLADPVHTLEAAGANLPAGLEIKAMENTDRVFHLVLPAKPTHLSDLDLERIAAGGEFGFDPALFWPGSF